jgi:hypothetical protein
VGGATLGHLRVVDGGQLGVELAGGVGGLDQLAAQRPRAGLGHGLVLAVGLAGLAGSGCQPGEGLERARVGEPSRPAHRGDQLRGADRAQPGQAGGQPGRVDMGEGGITGVLMPGPLGLGGLHQAHLAGDLGPQVVQGGGAVTVPQGDRLGRSGAERLGLGLTELAAAGGGDQPGQPGRSGGQQRPRVGVAFQHGQVGVVEALAQRCADGGDHRLGERADAVLAPADVGGEPGHGAHPTVQRRPRQAAELHRHQPRGGDQRQPGEVSASMPLLLAWRDKNRRRSAALAEVTRSTV